MSLRALRNPLVRIPLAVAGLWFLSGLFTADLSLRHGQTNKQFHAWSITESLARGGFDPLATTIPCPDPRTGIAPAPWAEEPPLFHALGALALKAGFGPAAVPMLLTFALMAGVAWLTLSALGASAPAGASVAPSVAALAALAAGSAPIFQRYQVQHLPDLLAAAALVWACAAFVAGRRGWAIALGFLAVTAKAFYVLPFAALFFGDLAMQTRGRSPTSARKFAGALLLVIATPLPFFYWLHILDTNGILNPFTASNAIENRHSGSLGMLFIFGYWGRFFNWLALKGAGPILFGAALLTFNRAFPRPPVRPKDSQDHAELLLWAWLAGVPLFWLLVRSGNYVHDYYSLASVPPIAALGAVALARLASNTAAPHARARRAAGIALLALSLGWGVHDQIRLILKPTPAGPAPTHCDAELPRHAPRR